MGGMLVYSLRRDCASSSATVRAAAARCAAETHACSRCPLTRPGASAPHARTRRSCIRWRCRWPPARSPCPPPRRCATWWLSQATLSSPALASQTQPAPTRGARHGCQAALESRCCFAPLHALQSRRSCRRALPSLRAASCLRGCFLAAQVPGGVPARAGSGGVICGAHAGAPPRRQRSSAARSRAALTPRRALLPQAGVEAAAANPAALLLFSGGATRAPAGPLSEAVSYWSVANALDWFDAPQVRPRCACSVAAPTPGPRLPQLRRHRTACLLPCEGAVSRGDLCKDLADATPPARCLPQRVHGGARARQLREPAVLALPLPRAHGQLVRAHPSTHTAPLAVGVPCRSTRAPAPAGAR